MKAYITAFAKMQRTLMMMLRDVGSSKSISMPPAYVEQGDDVLGLRQTPSPQDSDPPTKAPFEPEVDKSNQQDDTRESAVECIDGMEKETYASPRRKRRAIIVLEEGDSLEGSCECARHGLILNRVQAA